MRYVEHVKSNFLSPNGEPWEMKLGRLTLITGRNGAGKSMISHALRLPLKGETDDFGGKWGVKDPSALIDLAPFLGDGPLFSHLTFSDGANAAWGTYREEGTVKRPEHEAPGVDPGCCVLDAVRAALAGDERTARRYFLGWVAGGQSDADVLAKLPTHLHAKYTEIATAKKKPSDGPKTAADVLVSVIAHAQTQARDIETSAKSADEAAEALQTALGQTPRPDDATFAAAQKVVTDWEAYWGGCVRWETWTQTGGKTRETLTTEIEALKATQANAAATTLQWDTYAKGLRIDAPASDVISPVHSATIALIDILGDASQCSACFSTTPPGHLAQSRAWHAHQMAGAVAPAPVEQSADYTNAITARDWWSNEDRRIGQEITVLTALLSTAPESAPPPVQHSAAEAMVSLSAARTTLTAITNSRAQWDALKPAIDRAAALRTSIPEWKDLAHHGAEVVKKLLVGGQEAFATRVQAYVPERWTFTLKLVDPENTDREMFKIALVQPGAVTSGYMSGTQRDALMVAVAMVVAELGGVTPALTKGGKPKKVKMTGAPFFIAFPEDRSRDDETLKDLLKAWTKFPGQVIVENVTRPGRIPKEWTHIDLDEWRALYTKDEKNGEGVDLTGADPKLGGEGVTEANAGTTPEEAAAAAQPPAAPPVPPVPPAPVGAPPAPPAPPAAPAAPPAAPLAPLGAVTPPTLPATPPAPPLAPPGALFGTPPMQPPAPNLTPPPAVLSAPPSAGGEAPPVQPLAEAQAADLRKLLWPEADIQRMNRGSVSYVIKWGITPKTGTVSPDGTVTVHAPAPAPK